MNEPTGTPSRASIIVTMLVAVAMAAAAFWVGYPPDEKYTFRNSVGFSLGLMLAFVLMGQAGNRVGRRYKALRDWRTEQERREAEEKEREGFTGRWLHPVTEDEMLVLEQKDGVYRATGPILDQWVVIKDACGAATFSRGWAINAIAEAEHQGCRPAATEGTFWMRSHLGLPWLNFEPDDAVDSDA